MSRRIWLWIGFALALFAASFVYTYTYLVPDGTARLSETGGEAAKINAQSLIVLRYVLADERRGAEEKLEPVPANLVGVTLDELRKLQPNWSIVRFQNNELVAMVRCAQTNGGYLQNVDGFLGVFDGQPPCSAMRERTDIPVADLRADVQESLLKGLTFRNEDELQQLLDGLMGE